MTTTIWKRFTFEASHRLPNVPEGHKCARLHGHSYTVEIHVRGIVGQTSGWVMDFGDISSAWEPLRAVLDHRFLNEIDGLENPTSEVLARWIWGKLTLPGLTKVCVNETASSGCVYTEE